MKLNSKLFVAGALAGLAWIAVFQALSAHANDKHAGGTAESAATVVAVPVTDAAASGDSTATEAVSTWGKIRENVKIKSFSEFMTPSLGGSSSTPDTNGSALGPMGVSNWVSLDYKVAKNYSVVYWQRFSVSFASLELNQGAAFSVRNPRFAVRRYNVFDVPNLKTVYDVYVQPGLAAEAAKAGRNLEVGFRTSTSYSIPGSRFSLGATTEFTAAFSNNGAPGNNIYGWAAPWVSYQLSEMFSTQHSFSVGFFQRRGDSWSRIQLDTPMPYMQNGIGVQATKNIFVAALLNNYLTAAPTLANSWASLWLSMSLL